MGLCGLRLRALRWVFLGLGGCVWLKVWMDR